MRWLRRLLAGTFRLLVLGPLRWLWGAAAGLAAPAARALAGVSLVVAAVALADDIGPVTVGAPAGFTATSVVGHWQKLAPASHATARTMVTRTVGSATWGVLTAPLAVPTFVAFTLLGALLGFLGRRRRQVEIFAN